MNRKDTPRLQQIEEDTTPIVQEWDELIEFIHRFSNLTQTNAAKLGLNLAVSQMTELFSKNEQISNPSV